MDSEQIVKKSKQLFSDLISKADELRNDLPKEISPSSEKEKQEGQNSSSFWQQFDQQISDILSSFQSYSPKTFETMEELQELKERIWGGWKTISETYANSGRYIEAIQTIMKLMGRHQIFKVRNVALSKSEYTMREEEMHRQNANELAALCKKQGGAWVKAAQFISCHASGLPQVYSDVLAQLQDQANPIEWQRMVPVLEESFGPRWQDLIATIDPVPLATASIGQVHKAQLSHGPEIAIKIQIPGVSKLIQADLKFFESVAQIFNRQVETLDLEQIVRELSKSILKELDYYHEASNLTQFFGTYQNQQWEYPILVKELLTTRTMGMYFIEGMPIRQFLKEVPTAAESLLKELVHSFLKQIFMSGLFHADPHPGNFFVTPRGKIALLDFGAVARLTSRETSSYREVLTALLLEQFEGFDTILQKAGFDSPFPEKLKELLSQGKTGEYHDLTKMQYYLEVMRQAKVKIPDNFVLMARVLIVIGGLLRQYKIKIDLSELAMTMMSSSM
ncbi:MAG: AarF/ABC1/UbiB kinase family protein [SAR324 cluster bacterium]|nr:AarF/ABC1/UbiB kinase family protein [SAR324 cluster bacterium]